MSININLIQQISTNSSTGNYSQEKKIMNPVQQLPVYKWSQWQTPFFLQLIFGLFSQNLSTHHMSFFWIFLLCDIPKRSSKSLNQLINEKYLMYSVQKYWIETENVTITPIKLRLIIRDAFPQFYTEKFWIAITCCLKTY